MEQKPVQEFNGIKVGDTVVMLAFPHSGEKGVVKTIEIDKVATGWFVVVKPSGAEIPLAGDQIKKA